MSIITEQQRKLIDIVYETPLARETFWLAGGTALGEFYLKHRQSRDLDFFTDKKEDFKTAVREFQNTVQKNGIALNLEKTAATFARFTGTLNGEQVKVEFCVDSPYRFQPTTNSSLGVKIENSVDIACNKLSALYDRSEIRDFIDVYFIHKEMYNLDNLICWAKQKHSGMDNCMLAIAFQKINQIPDDSPLFPEMLKPLDKKDMRETFLKYAVRLIQEPFEARKYSQ